MPQADAIFPLQSHRQLNSREAIEPQVALEVALKSEQSPVDAMLPEPGYLELAEYIPKRRHQEAGASGLTPDSSVGRAGFRTIKVARMQFPVVDP